MDTERFKGVLDFFKTAIEILHGVGSPIKILTLAIVLGSTVLWVTIAGVLEATKAFKEKRAGLMKAEEKFPRFFDILYSGKIRFFLLLIVIWLFAIDWRDATTISPPSGVPKAPSAPSVTFVQQGSGSSDNKPLRMFVSAQMLEKVGDPSDPSRRMFVLLAITNKKVSPVDVTIQCNSDFVITEQPRVASEEEATMYLMTEAHQLSGNRVRYKMQSPAWGPESPMGIPVLVTGFDNTKPLKCTIKPQ
jgi:hypothetical protein